MLNLHDGSKKWIRNLIEAVPDFILNTMVDLIKHAQQAIRGIARLLVHAIRLHLLLQKVLFVLFEVCQYSTWVIVVELSIMVDSRNVRG